MPIQILAPAPAAPVAPYSDLSEEDDDPRDYDGDVDMEGILRGGKRARLGQTVVTPGEIVTDDPQWMRGHGTFQHPSSTAIHSTVSGTLVKTNKLLSILPLRARYNPEVGDLVVGRIVEVQSRRWKVDIGATLLAALPLSSINLPGGILRRRTAVDELNIRTFFVEGELLVAEIQSLFSDGSAALHTRSLKYGKLRNGYFMSVAGAGGSGGSSTRKGGVARSKRQTFTVQTARGGGEIDVVLGVNGFIWIARHVEPEGEANKDVSITRLEETASQGIYSSQNDEIGVQTRREIVRIAGVIRALVESGSRVDEDMIVKGYEASLEVDADADMQSSKDFGGVGDDWLGGEKGRRIVEIALGEMAD